MIKKLTPMMQQYLDCKERYPDAVLFFRLGDFYEMFMEDAEIVSRELGLTLTSRNKQAGDGTPMAGVPYHSYKGYVSQLIEKGYTVAIAEQLEDASTTKGMVKRDVVRVITPGVVLDTEGLEAKNNNYVAAISTSSRGTEQGFGLAYLDASTGDFRATEVSSINDLVSELNRVEAREILFPEHAQNTLEPLRQQLPSAFLRPKHPEYFNAEGLVRAVSKSKRPVGFQQQEGYFHGKSDVEKILAGAVDLTFQFADLVESAAAAAMRYVLKTQGGIPSHVRVVDPYRAQSFLILDESTKANLELTQTLMGGKKKGSLLHVIDRTVTAMGGRRLRHWLNYPLVDLPRISRRHDAIAELIDQPAVRQDLREAMDDVYDIERLCGRVAAGTANARDLRGLLSTLEVIPQIKDVLQDCRAEYLVMLDDALDPCEEICALIDRALVDDPPTALTEGGLFKLGFDDELDELIDASTNGKDWMIRYEAEQRNATGITSLKVKYNKVFGYFLEVTKSNLDQVPDTYIRKQTLSNAERYFTDELKEMEETVLGAEDKRKTLEYQLFEELRRAIGDDIGRLMQTASELANLDVITSLAELAVKRAYVRPEMTDDGAVIIEHGRHPVVEVALPDGERFVPNSVHLAPERRLAVITGPNMAGKSTVIRQVAIISLLAQMGSFVPAKSAKLGVVDKIFSRVGASDNLAKGQSTFMVEMTETAYILTHATPRSLVILDEIGRGTATFDGLSIAWSVAEYLHDHLRSKTMFATHYHELTELAESLEGALNMSIAVREYKDDIIFLRKLVDGPANRSYGIQVGRLAGLPDQVVGRAKEVLEILEQGHFEELQAEHYVHTPTSPPPPDAAPPESSGASMASILSGPPVPEPVPAPAPEPREEVVEEVVAEVVTPNHHRVRDPAPVEVALTHEPPSVPAVPQPDEGQLSLFGSALDPGEARAIQALREVSIGHMTPIQALLFLDKLSRELNEGS